MELKEVLGLRRSIRYFDPDRPVERAKIQKILEAMRLASCAVNAHWLRGVVVNRADLDPDVLASLKTPVAGVIQEMAPVHIYCYCDLGVVERVKGTRLKELVDVGALNPSPGWSHAFVDEVVYPQILQPLSQAAAYPIAASFDCGGAGTQGLLMAVDEGLGACWTNFNTDAVKDVFGIPADWIPLYVLNVGYPAESADAGGQRPRPPFEDLYFEGNCDVPFRRDPAVVDELKAAKFFTAPAPTPDRKREVRDLSRRFGLPE